MTKIELPKKAITALQNKKVMYNEKTKKTRMFIIVDLLCHTIFILIDVRFKRNIRDRMHINEQPHQPGGKRVCS